MRRTAKAITAALVIGLVVFFLVPVVWMDVVTCIIGGFGYASLSYFVFSFGMDYVNGHFGWGTQGSANCI